MALKIGDNFKYQGKQPNFDRDTFATLDEMKAFPETSIDEDFCRARFLSNYSGDLSYNLTSIFTVNDDITIIGF